jgi:hypothetical protein
MKKILLLLFILNLNLLKAQTFTFDSFACYSNEIKALGKIRENSCFINSNNNSYFLFLYSEKGNLEANLYNIKKLKSHHFKVEEKKVNGQSKFNFIFQFTKKHESLKNSNFADYVFDAKEIASTEVVKKMELNVYKNAKKRRSEMNVQFEYKEMPLNLFLAYKVCCLHPFEFDENLFLNKNCLVTKASEIALSGNKVEHKLIDYKEVNLELTIPE